MPCPAPGGTWGSRSGLPLPLPQSILSLSVRTKRLLTKSPANRVPSGFRDPASLATMTGSPNLTPCSVICLTLRSARHSFHASAAAPSSLPTPTEQEQEEQHDEQQDVEYSAVAYGGHADDDDDGRNCP